MALTNLTGMLNDARQKGYAIPAFDVSNFEMIRAVAEVCEEEKSPAIFILLNADMPGISLKLLVDQIRSAAAQISVPVCIHHDHATSFEQIARSIDAGVTSVMIDGSTLPYDENVRVTRQVTSYAHPLGITVEAELGHVADAIGGLTETRTASASDDDIERALTRPEEARRFIELTEVDCLAVAIGTAHGVYVSTPTLRFELLRRINEQSPSPLVLHGGSGTPDPDVQRAISLGITKINIYSEVLAALNSGLKDKLDTLENLSAWPCVVYSLARERMREVIRHKIRTFGSNGRA